MTTNMLLPQQLQITNGASKFDLMLALFDHKSERRVVDFTLLGFEGQVFQAGIAAVEAEDGSGESWLIKGTLIDHRVPEKKHHMFKGYFRTDKRTGWLELQRKIV